ncbi:hypothetical protein ACHAQH_004163 [Verticillium albo-atrum]
MANFRKWNTGINAACTNLWLGTEGNPYNDTQYAKLLLIGDLQMADYIDEPVRSAVKMAAVAVVIPLGIFLSVRIFTKGKGQAGVNRRWILALMIALPVFTISSILKLTYLALNLSWVSSFGSYPVSLVATLSLYQAQIFQFLTLFELSGWFAMLRNENQPPAHSRWSKHVGQFLAVVLTALNITWFALLIELNYGNVARNPYNMWRYSHLVLAQAVMLLAFGLGLLGVSINFLVKAKQELYMRKASTLFVIAAALNILPHLWYVIRHIVLTTYTGDNFPYWMELAIEYFQYWSTIMSLGLLYRLRSRIIKTLGPIVEDN